MIIPLGQILVSKGFISPEKLEEALELHGRLPEDQYVRLGKFLMANQYITIEQLGEALSEQDTFESAPIGQILIEQGVIRNWQLSHLLKKQHHAKPEERMELGAMIIKQGWASDIQIEKAIMGYYQIHKQKKQRVTPRLNVNLKNDKNLS